MKRFGLLIFLLSLILVFTHAENNDPHLIRGIEYINQNNFVQATKEFELTRNWTFDANHWIDVEKMMPYNQFTHENHLSTDISNNITLYIIEELKIIAHYQYNQGQYTLALNTYLYTILPFQRMILGEEHTECIASVNNIAMLYKHTGDYIQAKEQYKEALAITEKTLGENNEYYATILSNLANLSDKLGQIAQAEQYFLKALDILRKLSGYQTPSYATILDNLGLLYCSIGEYHKAEIFLLQAYTIRKAKLSTSHPDYATSLNNLGSYYVNVGDYPQSEAYFLQSLQYEEQIHGKNHPQYAIVASNLGILYQRKGDYEKAGRYFQLAHDIRLAILKETHPSYMSSVLNLGSYYEDIKNYTQAEECYLKVLNYRQMKYGAIHPNTAIVLNNLGSVHKKQKHYDIAQKYYQEALQIREQLGEEHPSYISSLNNLGIAYMEAGEYEKAEPYIIKVVAATRNQVVHAFNYMTDKQRESFWAYKGRRYDDSYQSFCYRYYPQKHFIAAFAFDNELFTKGLLLNSSNAVKNSVFESGDTALIRQWNELAEKRQQILILEQKNQQSTYLTSLREQAEQLEKDITDASSTYRESQRLWTITWDNVRAELLPNQVAIEYMSIPLTDDHALYCALLLRDTCSYPVMIPLFEEKEVSSLLHTSTGDTANINTTYMYGRNGSQLSKLIWSKVQPYLNPKDVVFVSPTGLLHQVAFENLPYDSIHTMTDLYNIVRLSSTRELALHKDPITHTAATLYGDIKYGVDPDVMYANNVKYRDIDREGIKDLPGTKLEIEAIVPILQNKNIEIHVFAGDTANEESFKALSGKKQNILHIGTHGFYWSDSTAKKQQYFGQRMLNLDENRHFSTTIDPLNRCGLLFAGANTAISGDAYRLQEGVQDGVLTAKEISLMDLRDADIVVLSACETGLGDVTGDGVFGLQRAFKMAGARTILMSLWKVDDDATRLLMTAFYRHYANGLSKREAFRNAQQEVRNYIGTNDIYSDDRSAAQDNFKNKAAHLSQKTSKNDYTKYPYQSPYYWAGFILLD